MVMGFKEAMTREFEMINLGLMKYFLGLEIPQCKSGIFVSQAGYAKYILKKSKMEECNPVATPMEPGTKLSKFKGGDRVDDPRYSHWKAVKRILLYLKGTESLGLFYSSSTKYKFLRYSDSKQHEDVNDLKNTSGYAFYFGDTAFTWASKKQPIVTLSTCEAKYVAASWCVFHAIWLRNLLSELQSHQHEATEIRIDNKSAIELARNPVHHERSKHIDVRFHFIKESKYQQQQQQQPGAKPMGWLASARPPPTGPTSRACIEWWLLAVGNGATWVVGGGGDDENQQKSETGYGGYDNISEIQPSPPERPDSLSKTTFASRRWPNFKRRLSELHQLLTMTGHQ
ncbi:retrovirus-related pol polyprotein from transposon TNT 1-94 [Tanacetum coccineum]|uniref:Retrovirus-related pol polyprotein from transposon TNT 1-94 n=1 Tax=Tanacetum coccineum TaxID=301880 RepID=A0ABQ4WNY3_9ASTR